jgi:hypothetical protein
MTMNAWTEEQDRAKGKIAHPRMGEDVVMPNINCNTCDPRQRVSRKRPAEL